MRKHLFCLLIIMMYSFGSVSIPYAYSMHTTINTPMQQYHSLQKELAKGWNTWDTRSVLTHVYLPYGFAIDLNLIDMNGHRASQFKVGARGIDKPILKPHAHTYDGTYTKMEVKWHGYAWMIESAAKGSTNIIIVTNLNGKKGAKLAVIPKSLWGRGNIIHYNSEEIYLAPKDKSVPVKAHLLGAPVEQKGRDLLISTDTQIAICCGMTSTLEQAVQRVKQCGEEFVVENKLKYGKNYDCYNVMQTILGWNNIYDPGIRKVITPVSRIWSSEWFASVDFGGFTLFCWDTYFASMMLAVGNKALAYANAVEITKAITESGFVPNCYYSNGFKSRDRSQPPVGSMAVWTLYQQYGDKWLLELLYNELLSWNNWWIENRSWEGLFCFGSSPYEKVSYFRSEYDQNTAYAACLESGLDNSSMFDGVPFNKVTHMQEQQDVGLSSLFVMDCDYLAQIAHTLNKKEDAVMLEDRADKYRDNINQLWDKEKGLYYNRSTQNGKFNRRISPTNFYPLLAKAASQKQAERMMKEHLLNPEEFWGEYVIPSVPRNDPAFKNNDYWRGRIWAPVNFLVYMGLRNYDLSKECRQLSDKSEKLLLKSWLKDGYVFENYNATTGEGDDSVRSDKFYHWGALLGYITLIENGVVEL